MDTPYYDWTTTELFEHCIEHDLIPQDSIFEDYMHDRSFLLSLIV
jgi:hypothetical protein